MPGVCKISMRHCRDANDLIEFLQSKKTVSDEEISNQEIELMFAIKTLKEILKAGTDSGNLETDKLTIETIRACIPQIKG